MFGWRNKSPAVSTSMAMRETLFGDMPWETWAGQDGPEPFHSFFEARVARESGDAAGAINALQRVVKAAGLESRCYVQAWHFLRALGVMPADSQGKHVLGVVIEVGMEQGLDLLAGYEDGSARYWNFSGAGVVWDARGDEAIDGAIRELLRRGQSVADRIGPWLEPRRVAPAANVARLNMLTPSGLHFGEGPLTVLSKDPMGGPLLTGGAALMQLLMEKGRNAHAGMGREGTSIR